jgi:hypothetical protein
VKISEFGGDTTENKAILLQYIIHARTEKNKNRIATSAQKNWKKPGKNNKKRVMLLKFETLPLVYLHSIFVFASTACDRWACGVLVIKTNIVELRFRRTNYDNACI